DIHLAQKSQSPFQENGRLSGYHSCTAPLADFLQPDGWGWESFKHIWMVHCGTLPAGRTEAGVSSLEEVAVRVICAGSGLASGRLSTSFCSLIREPTPCRRRMLS